MNRMLRTAIALFLLIELFPGCKVGDSSINATSSSTGSNGTTPSSAPPTVTNTTPLNGAIGFPVNRSITVTFSKPMRTSTLTTSTFTLSGPSSAVTGSVLPSGSTAVFTPAADLAPNATYTATIAAGVTDLAGNPMASNYSWSFTTAAVPDATPPTVNNTAPANSATDVAINSAVTVAFSEAINPATIAQTTFFVTGPSGTVSGTITPGSFSASFRPGTNLASTTAYTATVTTGIADLSNNTLAADYVWNFTTGTTADTTGPQWLLCTPGNGSTNNPIDTSYVLCFDDLLDPASVTSSTFSFRYGSYPGTPVSGAIFVTANCATFKPSSNLQYNSYYFMDSPPGITDLAGNPTTTFQSAFYTGPSTISDSTPPTVTQVRPEPNETGASLGPLYVVFSEAIYPPSLNALTFIVTGPSGTVNGTVVMSGRNNAIFIPASPLSRNTIYTATLTSGITDLVGHSLTSVYSWSFTTTNTGQIQRTSGYETASGLAQDAAGNIYTAGTTTGTLPGSTGSGRGFVAKYNSSHVLQWIKQFGAAASITVAGIAVDKTTGDVLVTGSTPAALDSQTFAGSNDLYLMKFDTNGNWQWTRLRGSATIDYAMSVAVDTAGNAYVTGYTYGGFDGSVNQGSSDIFLVKYDATGTWQWTRQRGTINSDQAYGITTFDDGLGTIFVYVVGSTAGSLDGITPPGGGDVALIAYDSNGNWQWTQLHGSSAADIGTAVTVDGSSNIYYTGYTFGTFEPGYSYTGPYSDGIVTKCSSTGNVIWAKQLGAGQQESMTSIAVDAGGNVYAAGSTMGNLFSAELLMPLNPAPNNDVMLVKFNSAGSFQWGRQPGTWWSDMAAGVVADSGGTVYVYGTTYGDLNEMTSQGIHGLFYRTFDSDAFLMSFDSSGNKQ